MEKEPPCGGRGVDAVGEAFKKDGLPDINNRFSLANIYAVMFVLLLIITNHARWAAGMMDNPAA